MYLGLDIGTSGVKAVLIDAAGRLVAQSNAALSVERPHPLWSEQDPAQWWRACDAAVQSLPAAQRADVKAIGLAGQMHGATVLDAADRPLRPAILWNDGRSHEECRELEARVPEGRRISGNLAMPGFTAPKLLWLKKHEPAVFKAIRSVLLPKDYVRLCMTGEKFSDCSDAAGTWWLDVGARRWSTVLLAATDLDERQMPRLVEGAGRACELRADIAQRWGMQRVPVAGGGGDNAAGAVGVGAVDDGDALISLGTSGVSFVATNAFRPAPERAVHAFCHCLPARWHLMAVHLSAAVCVDWVARVTGVAGPAEVFAAAERATPGPELFLPYLSGERTPHNDAEVRGAFLGLDHDSNAERLSLAVLEGVAFAIADGVDAIRSTGQSLNAASVIGGGARSRFWGRIIASALDLELRYLDGGDVGPALGAARLAQLAQDGGPVAQVCMRPPVRYVQAPEPALRARLLAKQEFFKQGYHRIKPGTHP